MSWPGQPDLAPSGRQESLPQRLRRAARRLRWTRWLTGAGIATAFLVVPPLSHLPAHLVSGCATWVAIAGALELASVLGFVAAFALVFGDGLTARQSLVGGLRALGASTILPGGSLVGPAVAARSIAHGAVSLRRLAAPSVAFVLLTTAPGVVVLGLTGIGLWLGWLAGPHGALLTLPAAAGAVALLAGAWLLGRPQAQGLDPARARPRAHWARWPTIVVARLREGSADARRLVLAGDWKLLGAVAYYVFDNAVLWAAFRAYGSKAPLAVLVMGYLVGSLGSAVPTPAGLGTVEGGLFGALVLYGAPLAPAAAAILLYRGISLGIAVALGACGWVSHARTADVGAPHAPCADRATSRFSIMRPRSRPSMPPRPSPAAGHSRE